VGGAEEKVDRVTQNALPGQSNAQLVANGAGRAIARDKIVSLNDFALAGLEIDYPALDRRSCILKVLQAGSIPQLDARPCEREVAQNRIEPHLRTRLEAHRAPRLGFCTGDRGARDAAEFETGKTRDEDRVACVILREWTVVNFVCDTPTAAE